jgi:HlyD family secretion protein
MPLLTVESGAKQAGALEAVMYLPVQQGKTIVPGMAANIYPSSVNREEYGFIRGRVTTVSEYPVTAQAMMATIGSEALVAELAGRGAALLEVRIAPLLDPGTASGYKWSTTDGPPVRIDSGTPVTASIIIKTQKPITSIIPQIK